MKIHKLSLILTVLLTYCVYCQNPDLKQVEFLIGTWKIEGKESYESWEKKEKSLKGISFNIENGQKEITENIEVLLKENNIYPYCF